MPPEPTVTCECGGSMREYTDLEMLTTELRCTWCPKTQPAPAAWEVRADGGRPLPGLEE